MAKYNKVRDYESHQTNPFVEKAISDIKIIKKNQVVKSQDRSEIQMIVNQSGEVEGHTAFMRFVEVEEDKFTKVYLNQFHSFWDLSKSAIRVFGYIMTVLIPKKDWFYFDMTDCLKYTKYSTEKSVFEGIGSLIENGIIARSESHIKYYINPLVIFNGDRVSFAKTYIKKKKQENNSAEVQKIELEAVIDTFENNSLSR